MEDTCYKNTCYKDIFSYTYKSFYVHNSDVIHTDKTSLLSFINPNSSYFSSQFESVVRELFFLAVDCIA